MKTTRLLPLLLVFAAAPTLAASKAMPPATSSASHKVNAELKTALAHAQMAQGATSLAVSQTHLHHAINCLVGPKGITFDAKAGNPCAKLGQGAINDGADRKAVREVLRDIDKGLEAKQLAQARQAAENASHAIMALIPH